MYIKKTVFIISLILIGVTAGLWAIGYADGKNGTLVFNKELRDVNTANEVSQIVNTHDVVPGNKTKDFSEHIISVIVEGGASDLSEEELVSLLQNGIDDALETTQNPPPQHTISEISIVEPSKENINEYKNALADILISSYYPGLTDEYPILYEGLTASSKEKKDDAHAKLRRASLAYKKISEALLSTPTPPDYANRHIEMVNAYELLSVGTNYFASSLTDPFLAVEGLKLYEHARQVLELISRG